VIPRFGEPAQRGRRYQLRPGAYAILAQGARVLLTHQSTPTPEYQLPGGGIDPGESPLAALFREVVEETGWRIAYPRRLGAFRRFTYMPEYEIWAEKLCHVYVARPVRKLRDPSEPGHTALWVSPNSAIEILGNDGDRHFLSRYFSTSGPL